MLTDVASWLMKADTQKYDDVGTQVLPDSQDTLPDGIVNPDTRKHDDADTQSRRCIHLSWSKLVQ